MKNVWKRIGSIVLALCLFLTMLPMVAINAEATTLTRSEFEAKLADAQTLYPTGSQREEWSIGGTVVGWQCHGYGRWLSWYIWGVDFANGNGANWILRKSTSSTTSIDSMVPGDVVRFRRISAQGNLQTWNHTIFITDIIGDTIYYTDCNSDGKCTIKWGQNLQRGTLESWLKLPLYGNEAADYGYIAHYTPNTLTSSDVPQRPSVITKTPIYAAGGNITISWNAALGNSFYWINVFKDGKIIVDQTTGTSTSYTLTNAAVGEYLFYVSANNSAGTSGSSSYSFSVIENKPPEAPTIKTSKSCCKTGESITVSWNAVDNAALYRYYLAEFPTVYIYDSHIKSGTTTGTSLTLSDLPHGKYLILVQAANSFGTWSKDSNYIWIDFYNYDYTPVKTEIWNGHLYALYDAAMSWDLAQALCEMEQGDLVTITSQQENDFVKKFIKAGSLDAYWLGARNDDRSNYELMGKEFRWVTGENFSYSDWAAGEPNGMGTGAEIEHFAEIRKSIGSLWNDVKHTTKNGFVLEVDISSYTPIAKSTYGSSQYLLFEENIAWTEAKAFCESLGGHLAVISSTAEDGAITDLLNKGNASRHWYYIGASNQSGTWKWVDGTTVPMSGTIANWGNVSGTVQTGPTGWGDYLMKYRSTGTWIGIQNFYAPVESMNGIGFICEIDNSVYTVSYNANGGAGSPAAQSKLKGTPLTLSSTVPQRSGYSFVGWATKSNATQAEYQPGGIYSVDQTVTLYAVWKSNCDNGHSYSYKVSKSPATSVTGTLTGTCSKCNGTTTVTLPKLNTADYNYQIVKAAACTATGTGRYTWKTTTYGKFYFDVSIAAIGHSYSYKATKVPTTSTTGILTGTCSICSGTTTVNLPKLNSTDYTYKITKEATCTTAGNGRYTWKTTTYGSFYFDVSIAAVGHYYTDEVTAPTCTQKGYTTHMCSCGESFVDSYVNALGHDMGKWTVVTAATCTKDGSEYRSCSRCDHYETRTITAPGHDHKAKVKAPTCTEQGYTTYTCHCGDSYVSDYTNALGHNISAWRTVRSATCTENGEEQRNCTRCDHRESRTIEAVGHRWDNGVVTREPTEETEGERLYTCTACGATRTETIPVIGHEHSYGTIVTAPTCTEQGYTTYTCRCGESYTEDYVDALGHAWGDWIVIQEPTTTENGVEEHTCTRCGHAEQRSIAKLENPFNDVAPGSFYYEPVMWAIENGITSGTTPTTFGPNDQCMRAHVVTFLWRAVGSPEPKLMVNPFVDVKPTDFYYKPVLWALENGITSGMDATHFGPTAYCNRAQVVTFLYRTMGSPDVGAATNPFTDVAAGSFYENPVLWAVENGVTAGLSATSFGPNSICNRAQIVTFLYRAFVD